jgi:hypothetical protein
MIQSKVINNEVEPLYPFSLNFAETLKYIKETRNKNIMYKIDKIYQDKL